ncbi:nucleotide sugar dehydratase [Rhodospirillum rubrum]|uniref:polysaccharide biosynthesis protein n=1 Tax=Rhodospirillum rubrum TaxID=1085 RepID=UPI001903A8CD|nr:nucleoside-diphosphate sugar epimerase/dehydratase [Rhodospirillum rubrum]MBK1663261.1 nucleotide sugar dehydratase [Rhodospirillum rubrum]MBK1676178.1 nucleotide sugar dehydratase [Rhodospirillum rubrum]
MRSLFPPMPPRARIVFAHDVVMAALSFVISLYLRLGDGLIRYVPLPDLGREAALFAACAAVAFYTQRMYVGIWRYASVDDLIALLRGATLTLVLFLPAAFLITRMEYVPRSVLVINWVVLMALLGGPRFLYRLFKDRKFQLRRARSRSAIPVLLVGAGDGCEMFLRSVARETDSPYLPVGILSEQETRVGRNMRGVEVLGTLDRLAEIVVRLERWGERPRKLILTSDTLDPAQVRGLLDACDALGLSLARLPRLMELRDGGADSLEVRPVAIEDLLGRPQAVLDRAPVVALVGGRRVLVTGAGGSIGSELVRQIAALGPSRLILADSSEFALYTIDMEITERYPTLSRRPVIADVRDGDRIDRVMAEEKPELVFHAAALKHVPMVEFNPLEGLRTNALGTRTVAEACRRHGVGTMVLISTDKAVNPTNVMGASKRMAESWCQALDLAERTSAAATHFVTVRFGNVLGSTGSVVPLFQRQLAAGGPLTVTHPEITRFFMTIREAVELVLQAAALGSREESYRGSLFVLDMGEPVKIADLARQMIRLAGLKPEVDVQIAYTGLRPGEKLFEEIFHGKETSLPTPTDGVLVAAPRVPDPVFLGIQFDALARACAAGDEAQARAVIAALVPEFHNPPAETAPQPFEGECAQARAVL